MLHITDEEENIKLKIYTNIAELKNDTRYHTIEYIEEVEIADLCIIREEVSEATVMKSARFIISVDSMCQEADLSIKSEELTPLLELFEVTQTEVGMADFNDLLEVAKGRLVYYIKCKSTDIEQQCQIIQKYGENISVLVYFSKKDFDRMNFFIKKLEEMSSNIKGVILAPVTAEDENTCMDLFVFQ